MRSRIALLISALLALTLALVFTPTASADVTTGASFDAHVQSTAASTNFATNTTMPINTATATRYSFIQVNVPSVPGGESHVGTNLNLYMTHTSGDTLGKEVNVDLVSNSWTETGVTWNNQPAVITSNIAPTVTYQGISWYVIPLTGITPGTTASFRIRTNATAFISIHSQENASGNGPSVTLDTQVIPVQNPSATRNSTDCGVVDLSYATGAGDNTPSTFVTTIDGVEVDNEVVSAPSGTGGHNETLAEDSSDGSSDVVVTGNGNTLLSFAVDTDCVTPPTGTVMVGMSASADLWDQRLSEVGACGVEARRIFADLVSSGSTKTDLIADAIAAGMMPVISYKVPNVATLNSNGYDSWLNNLNAYLDGLDVPVTVTFNHEPYPELIATEFKNGSQQFLDHINAPNAKVGPIMNGWLMDNQMATFSSYSTPALISQWDFFGVDSYQGGTESNPDPVKYGGRAVPLLRAWLDGQGFTDEQIILGEYNGYTAASIDQGGDQVLLAANKVLAGLVFNSDVGAKGFPLSGQRLIEYQEDKADPRALHDPAC